MPISAELCLAYLATIGVFFASPPGPSQALMIPTSLAHGLRRSATAAGDLGANALQMIAAAFGLAVLVASSATALTVLKWAGVAYLVWVGIRTIRRSARQVEPPLAPPGRALYTRGFLTSGTNLQAVFVFATLFPQFIVPARPIWPQLVLLGGTYLVVDGALRFAWGSAERQALGVLRRRPRLLGRVSGGAVIAAGGLLALRSADAR